MESSTFDLTGGPQQTVVAADLPALQNQDPHGAFDGGTP
jgi:hypothetical protein